MNSYSEDTSPRTAPQVVASALVVTYGRRGKSGFGLHGFDATFSPGITGLVGPNGAGKTTFLRTACGLLSPDSGHIEIQGKPPTIYVAESGIGFLPENPELPGYLTVGEFLEGLPPFEGRQPERNEGARWILRVEELLERSCGALSMGQRKKVALAASLKGSPDVLLLDEPTNGLDPMAVKELRRTLMEERERGITIIVSSHHLDELQRIADALVFVREGELAGAWTRSDALTGFSSLEALFDHVFVGGEDDTRP